MKTMAQRCREWRAKNKEHVRKYAKATRRRYGQEVEFDERLLRAGRDIPQCPYGKWAFPMSTRKHNGIVNYGYTV